VRTVENLPLIRVLAPTALQTVDPGANVTIRWEDDVPDEDEDDPSLLPPDEDLDTEVMLVLRDDPDPFSGSPDEATILTGRKAARDGVLDSYTWSVPLSVAPGVYYITAYIDSDGAAPADSAAVAAGRIIVRDPTGN
jgi:hypothetical protein